MNDRYLTQKQRDEQTHQDAWFAAVCAAREAINSLPMPYYAFVSAISTKADCGLDVAREVIQDLESKNFVHWDERRGVVRDFISY